MNFSNGTKVFVLILIISLIPIIFFLISIKKEKTVKITSPKIIRNIAIGAWTEGFYDAKGNSLHPEKLTAFETMVQKKMSIAHYYLGWEYLKNPVLIDQFKTLRASGWVPMLNVNPYFFDSCKPKSGATLYKSIANGDCDEFLKESGKNLSKIDQPFYLLFAWEMNNDLNEWSIPYTGSSDQDFINAWRHMHNIFKEEGAKNIIWVFCPNAPEDDLTLYKNIYPGGDYVDWVGLDGYNWGNTQSWSSWTDFSGVFTNSYNLITDVAPGKPVMIAEVNTTEKGGDKGAWYKDMFEKIPDNFPKISAVIIFNEDKSKNEKVNWRVDVTSEALNSFRAGINKSFYK